MAYPDPRVIVDFRLSSAVEQEEVDHLLADLLQEKTYLLHQVTHDVLTIKYVSRTTRKHSQPNSHAYRTFHTVTFVDYELEKHYKDPDSELVVTKLTQIPNTSFCRLEFKIVHRYRHWINRGELQLWEWGSDHFGIVDLIRSNSNTTPGVLDETGQICIGSVTGDRLMVFFYLNQDPSIRRTYHFRLKFDFPKHLIKGRDLIEFPLRVKRVYTASNSAVLVI